MCDQYVPPKGSTSMWFIAHTGTPGCERVLSIDFARCLDLLPDQDHVLEAEFERLRMPLPPPFEPTYDGQLLGIVCGSHDTYTGRTDPHVLAVRGLLQKADVKATTVSYDRIQPIADVVVEGYTYSLMKVWTLHPTITPEYWAEGARPTYDISIYRTRPGWWTPDPVRPLMVGAWGHVAVDPDGGGAWRR